MPNVSGPRPAISTVGMASVKPETQKNAAVNPPAHQGTLSYNCTLCLLLAVVVMATAGCHSTRPQSLSTTSLKRNDFNAVMARMEQAARLESVPLERVGEPVAPPTPV